MNTLQMTDVEYLRPNRTIETVQLYRGNHTKSVFIFNYEGIHFRVFKKYADAQKVASGDTDVKILAEFEKESDLEKFLETDLRV